MTNRVVGGWVGVGGNHSWVTWTSLFRTRLYGRVPASTTKINKLRRGLALWREQETWSGGGPTEDNTGLSSVSSYSGESCFLSYWDHHKMVIIRSWKKEMMEKMSDWCRLLSVGGAASVAKIMESSTYVFGAVNTETLKGWICLCPRVSGILRRFIPFSPKGSVTPPDWQDSQSKFFRYFINSKYYKTFRGQLVYDSASSSVQVLAWAAKEK